MSAKGRGAGRGRPGDGGADRADRRDRPGRRGCAGAARSGPQDAYGALLRAIVGQQLSTKAARTIYLRVLDIFDGVTPSPEQLLEAERGGAARRRPLRAARSSTCATSPPT